MNLLSVDWDFFTPICVSGPYAYLYDWEHRDQGTFFIESIWQIRASVFLQQGLPLPDTSGDEIGFWDRFKFAKNAKLYYGDSHALIMRKCVRSGVRHVINYDAHHDAGYGLETPEDVTDCIRQHGFDCSSWALDFHLHGLTQRMVYPSWKSWGKEWEYKPAFDLVRTVDDAQPLDVVFDRVFLCRSGGWSPSWLDSKFEAFLSACPVKRRLNLGMPARYFLLGHSQELADQIKRCSSVWVLPSPRVSSGHDDNRKLAGCSWRHD